LFNFSLARIFRQHFYESQAMKKVLVASNNPGKIREIASILAELNMEVVAQKQLGITEADETGLTFVENALIKARHAALSSGMPAIADDSGLEVDVLKGRPGVFSARFAGPKASDRDNNQMLLNALSGCDVEPISARFRCVMVYLRHAEDPSPLIGEGVWEGEIIREAKGEGGFGYDPYFWVRDMGCTVAEMGEADKNRLSHRGKALRSLFTSLAAAHV
jgi:XTP/dITP diphosphohydrolase